MPNVVNPSKDMALEALDSLEEQLEAAERERGEARMEIARWWQTRDWLVKQLDNCIDDAEILESAKPLAIGRALIGNLKDARKALDPSPAKASE